MAKQTCRGESSVKVEIKHCYEGILQQEKEFEEQRQNDEKLKRKRTEQKDRLEKVSFDMMRDIMQLRGTGGSSKAMRRDGSRMIGIMHALTSVQASGLRTRAIQEEHGAEENDKTRAGGAD